ncbi:MAG: YkuS family protein [Clostridium sp.]|nr:YkuS family protein [Clostridium sp.]
MKICIPDELNNIKKQLEDRGYEIVSFKSKEKCDAVICDLKNGGLSNLNGENNIKKDGMLIIDIGSRNIDEIENILKNRLYTSIF